MSLIETIASKAKKLGDQMEQTYVIENIIDDLESERTAILEEIQMLKENRSVYAIKGIDEELSNVGSKIDVLKEVIEDLDSKKEITEAELDLLNSRHMYETKQEIKDTIEQNIGL